MSMLDSRRFHSWKLGGLRRRRGGAGGPARGSASGKLRLDWLAMSGLLPHLLRVGGRKLLWCRALTDQEACFLGRCRSNRLRRLHRLRIAHHDPLSRPAEVRRISHGSLAHFDGSPLWFRGLMSIFDGILVTWLRWSLFSVGCGWTTSFAPLGPGWDQEVMFHWRSHVKLGE